MATEITVRGAAERRWPAERGTVDLTVALRGADRAEVAREAAEVHGTLTARLADLRSSGAVEAYSADAVRVMTERPWRPEGGRGDLVQTARLGVRAEFYDLEALSAFVGDWSADPRVEIDGVAWDLAPERRRECEAQVRSDAVRNAVATAQAYADAVDAGVVRPTHLSDPGMLGSPVEPQMMKAMSADASGGGLSLHPGEIVVRCEVDARFVAG